MTTPTTPPLDWRSVNAFVHESGVQFEELQGLCLALASALEKRSALLTRYRNETPLGHQPHMIAHEVDAALTPSKQEGA